MLCSSESEKFSSVESSELLAKGKGEGRGVGARSILGNDLVGWSMKVVFEVLIADRVARAMGL